MSNDKPKNAIEEVSKSLGPVPVSTQVGISAMAMQMALNYHDSNIIKDGTMYQQLKIEGAQITGLNLDLVFETAMRIERHLVGGEVRVNNLLMDLVETIIDEGARRAYDDTIRPITSASDSTIDESETGTRLSFVATVVESLDETTGRMRVKFDDTTQLSLFVERSLDKQYPNIHDLLTEGQRYQFVGFVDESDQISLESFEREVLDDDVDYTVYEISSADAPEIQKGGGTILSFVGEVLGRSGEHREFATLQMEDGTPLVIFLCGDLDEKYPNLDELVVVGNKLKIQAYINEIDLITPQTIELLK